MSKSAGEQTTTQTVDPQTQAYINEVRDRARQVSSQPYTANPNPTVAGVNPVSIEGLGGMRDALGQLNFLGGASANMGELLNQRSNQIAGLSSQYGDRADLYSGALANRFDSLAGQMRGQGADLDALSGRMRGVADQYGGYVPDMLRLGSQFDQQAHGTDALAQGFDQRSQGLDALGARFNPYFDAGNQGASALAGNADAVARLMNPFESQVMDSVASDYDKQRALAHVQANDAATRAGAFGGDRHAIMEGARLGELDQGQMATMAGLRAQGYDNAMAQAAQAANLGLGAGQYDLSAHGLGQSERGMGLQARQLGQGYNQLGLSARGLGAQFGGLGLNAEQVGQGYNGLGLDAAKVAQGYNGLGMDARNLGYNYDNLGLGAMQAATGANQAALGAYGQAGQLAGAGANISQGIFNAGDYLRSVDQAKLSDQDARFREARDWQLRNLGILQSGATGLPYGTTQSTPLTRNVGSGVLGGAATGASIGSVIPGVGTAIGAGVGGLLGLFG